MPLIRKIIMVGKTSKAVIIPKSWLEHFEEIQGCEIQKVAIEVNQELRISPVLKEARRSKPE